MLHEFLSSHRTELIERCRRKVALRSAPKVTEAELEHGVPLFLDQLIKTLQVEQTAEPMLSRKVSGPSGGGSPAHSEIGETAARHGHELLNHGFTVEQVVHDYGNLCQSIADLAVEKNSPIEIDEFRTLNRCLDNGIADAVTEYNYQRDSLISERHSDELNQRLGFLAHELRNLIATATLAVTVIKTGDVGINGATGAMLDRSLVGLTNLIDRSLTEVRMAAGLVVQHRLFSLAEFIADVKLSAMLEANFWECQLTVSEVDPQLAVDADRDLLFSALGNLLQNAFKFTHPGSEVTLNIHSVSDRILIDIEDHCGGLPSGEAETMFQPFEQRSANKTGLGLGLSIARQSVEANQGLLTVRDIPGTGCVFTIDLPRHSLGEVAETAPSPSLPPHIST